MTLRIPPVVSCLLALAASVFAAAAQSASPAPREDDRPVEEVSRYKKQVKADTSLPTIYLAGDSTVRVNSPGQRGWGDELAPYFDSKKVNIVNLAIGGRSTRTYLTDGRWEDLVARLQPGDAVFIQFGHNDGGKISEDPPVTSATRVRGTIKGVGDESQDIYNILTKKQETVHSYGWYLRKFIDDVRAKKAVAILCTPIPHKSWEGAKITDRPGPNNYGGWAIEVAKQKKAPLLDICTIIADGYEKEGPAKVEKFFADARTHTTPEGAAFNARAVVSALKGLPGNPFQAYFSTKAAFVPAVKGPVAQ